MTLPNFVIAGAPKAGTSSLFTWIADHPECVGSREKETYFFVDPGTHMFREGFNAANGIEGYSEQFEIASGASPKIVLEATPSYLYMATALKHVPDLPTEPRCMFVVREPSAQIYSLYQYFRNNWDWIPAEMGFREFLVSVREGTCDFKGNELAQNAVAYARYADFLVPWKDRLGEDRMLVMTFDDLIKDPVASTVRVAEWLGIDASFYEDYDFPKENESYVPKNRMLQQLNILVRGSLPKGKIYEQARAVYRRLNTSKPQAPEEDVKELVSELRAEFIDDNRRLEGEFGLDLSGWSGSLG